MLTQHLQIDISESPHTQRCPKSTPPNVILFRDSLSEEQAPPFTKVLSQRNLDISSKPLSSSTSQLSNYQTVPIFMFYIHLVLSPQLPSFKSFYHLLPIFKFLYSCQSVCALAPTSPYFFLIRSKFSSTALCQGTPHSSRLDEVLPLIC